MRIKNMWFVLLLIYGFSTIIQSSNIINIQLRFYQGFNEKQNITDSERSFSLKNNNLNILSFQEIEKEIKSIINIYNLREIKNISNLSFNFIDNKKKQTKQLYFDSKDIKICLTRHIDNINKFELMIYKGIKNDNTLMDTELILPAEKAAVIGFRDKENNIYFFSIYRKDDTEVKKQSKHQLIPEIISEKVPQYPKEALAIGKNGYVILEGKINKYGKIQNTKIWKGEQLLNKAALTAFNNWKFKSYKVSPDKLKKVVLILVFEINKENKDLKNKLEKIKKTNIWKQIVNTKINNGKPTPWLLKVWIIQGKK